MTDLFCCEGATYIPNTEFTYSSTVAAGNSEDIVTDAMAAGRQYWILSCRVVSASGTTTSVTYNSTDICAVSPVTFEGAIEDVLLSGHGLAFDVTGAGSATCVLTGKWA